MLSSARSAIARPFACGVSALVLGAVLWAGEAAAQVPTAPGQTREEVDPARQAPPIGPAAIDAATLARPETCPFAGKGQVALTRIEVRGGTLVADRDFQAAVADLLGGERELSVICEARDRIARLYADRGEALVRVDLPEQRVSGGVLVVNVTEGRIVGAALRQPEALGPAAALAEDYLDSLASGRATRWRDVERAFLLVRDIPGADVSFGVRRSEDGAPDGLEAVAAFAPRRKLDVTLSGQNFASRAVGREGASVRLDANSFTRFGERTSLVLFSGLEGRQRVVQILEEVRLGGSGLSAFADVAYSRSEPGGALEALELEGRSLVARLGARYPLVLNRTRRLDVSGAVEWIDQTNDLGAFRQPNGDATALFEESLSVLSVGAAGRWRPAPGVQTVFDGELRKGLDALGASEAGDPLLSRPEGRPDFTSLRARASVRRDFALEGAAGLYVALTASGQWAGDPLPAYEEFQIGAYSVGRGFDPGAASGDKALAGQAEAGWDVAADGVIFTVFSFVDGAKLWNQDAAGYDSRPWSLGAGVRARSRLGQIGLTYAVPQSAPFPGAETPDPRLLFTLSTTFSFR